MLLIISLSLLPVNVIVLRILWASITLHAKNLRHVFAHTLPSNLPPLLKYIVLS